MKYYSKKQWTHKLTVMVLLAMALGGTAVQAMPSGGDIRSGQGSISQDGKNMTVLQNSDRMAIDWTKFDIAKDETVRYAQPDRNAISSMPMVTSSWSTRTALSLLRTPASTSAASSHRRPVSMTKP